MGASSEGTHAIGGAAARGHTGQVRYRLAAGLLGLVLVAACATELAVGSGPGLQGTVREDSLASKALDGRLRFAV